MEPSHTKPPFERPPPRLGRRLPTATQWVLVVAGILVLAFGFLLTSWLGRGTPEELSDRTPAVAGRAFKATDKQWQALRIRSIEEATFQDSVRTEGKIVLDDDLVTPVFSPLSGHVTRLLAHAGDVVRAGDPLFAIRSTELAQAQNDLIAAAAALKTTRAQFDLATTNEKRQHALYLAQGAALKDWQQARVDLATAEGGMNSASIALAAVRSRLRILGKSDQEIDHLETTPDIVHLDADSLVHAPIGGTIVQRQIGLGQNIVSASSGASNPVFMIGDLSKVWLVANAREESAPYLRVGDEVQVSVLAYPSKVFKAKLSYVAASLDPNTHRLPVRAEVENPNSELKPEMFASFRIISGNQRHAPAVPVSAVVYEGETQHVWVADPKDKTLAIRDFQAGRTDGDMVEVISGLKPGEDIVTAGALFIDRAVTGD